MSRHFGYESNGVPCKLGCHWGCGIWTPEQRAAHAARMRATMPTLLTGDMLAFLNNWEKHHGMVHYRMEQIGENTGTFKKSSKGEPILVPVYIDPYAIPENDLFKRAGFGN